MRRKSIAVLLCDDCVVEHTCDHCGETIWEQNSVSDEDTCLYQECFDENIYIKSDSSLEDDFGYDQK